MIVYTATMTLDTNMCACLGYCLCIRFAFGAGPLVRCQHHGNIQFELGHLGGVLSFGCTTRNGKMCWHSAKRQSFLLYNLSHVFDLQ